MNSHNTRAITNSNNTRTITNSHNTRTITNGHNTRKITSKHLLGSRRADRNLHAQEHCSKDRDERFNFTSLAGIIVIIVIIIIITTTTTIITTTIIINNIIIIVIITTTIIIIITSSRTIAFCTMIQLPEMTTTCCASQLFTFGDGGGFIIQARFEVLTASKIEKKLPDLGTGG